MYRKTFARIDGDILRNNIVEIKNKYSNYEYYIENKIMYMNVDEVEKSNSIVPSNREMIYLYLPKDTDVTLHYTSDSGFLDVSKVDLRHLLVNTKSGIVSLSKVDVDLDIDVTTVSGKVILKELLFEAVLLLLMLLSCFTLMSSAVSYKEGISALQEQIDLYNEAIAVIDADIAIIDNQIKTKYQIWLDVSHSDWVKTDTGPLYNAWVFQADWNKDEYTIEDDIFLSYIFILLLFSFSFSLSFTACVSSTCAKISIAKCRICYH